MNAKRLIKSEISAALVLLGLYSFVMYMEDRASLLDLAVGIGLVVFVFGYLTAFFYEFGFCPPEELHPLDDFIAEISEEHSVQNRASKLNRSESLAGQGKNED